VQGDILQLRQPLGRARMLALHAHVKSASEQVGPTLMQQDGNSAVGERRARDSVSASELQARQLRRARFSAPTTTEMAASAWAPSGGLTHTVAVSSASADNTTLPPSNEDMEVEVYVPRPHPKPAHIYVRSGTHVSAPSLVCGLCLRVRHMPVHDRALYAGSPPCTSRRFTTARLGPARCRAPGLRATRSTATRNRTHCMVARRLTAKGIGSRPQPPRRLTAATLAHSQAHRFTTAMTHRPTAAMTQMRRLTAMRGAWLIAAHAHLMS
jgi:hypothetical protein